MCREPQSSAPTEPVTLWFRATPLAVRSALVEIDGAWASIGVPAALREIGQQVLAEVLNNVVEHALADRPNESAQLQTGWSGTKLTCTIRDDGHPMPGLQIPQGQPARITANHKDLPEGGFGWFMIRSLTQDLTYKRAKGWNQLRFTITDDAQE